MSKNRRLDAPQKKKKMRHLDDNILQEILSWVPAKSLGRFKSTCRRWRDLISDPYFKAAQSRKSLRTSISGLFSVTMSSVGGSLGYVSLDGSTGRAAPDTTLGLPDPPRINIKAACNGLILYQPYLSIHLLLLSNPTTGAHRRLPYYPGVQFGLAFDPAAATSPVGFRVVALTTPGLMYGFAILDEGGAWRVSHETLPWNHDHRRELSSSLSLFYRGTLHWLESSGGIVAFNVEEEKAYGIDLPEGVRSGSIAGYPGARLGLARGCMSLVSLGEGEVLVWALVGGRWELEQKIGTKGSPYHYMDKAPLFYDGRTCVLLVWKERGLSELSKQDIGHELWTPSVPTECGVAVYRTEERRWDDKMRRLEEWMDRCRHFFPHISHMVDDVLQTLVRNLQH